MSAKYRYAKVYILKTKWIQYENSIKPNGKGKISENLSILLDKILFIGIKWIRENVLMIRP